MMKMSSTVKVRMLEAAQMGCLPRGSSNHRITRLSNLISSNNHYAMTLWAALVLVLGAIV